MSEELKRLFKKDCVDGKHVGPIEDGDCWSCSTAHVEEFGESLGIVIGLTDYNNEGEVRDERKVGPEVDVRWLPDYLRYAYAPEHLVEDANWASLNEAEKLDQRKRDEKQYAAHQAAAAEARRADYER